MKRTVALTLATAVTAAFCLGAAGTDNMDLRVPPRQRRIDLAICLDTSNSMDGLIASAKQKLWAVVSELATAKPRPTLRVALYQYGNNSLNGENGWVHPEFGFDQGFASFVAETSGTLATTRSHSLRWLRRHAELPFFLFLHTYQPHQPYDPSPPYDTIFLDSSHVGYALPGLTVPVEMLEDFQAGFYSPTRADLEAFIEARKSGGAR